VAKIELGQLGLLQLGNLDAKRDWGYAKDYVEGMWKMLQVECPDTYVLATNRTQSVRDFVNMAFKAVGRTLEWQGEAENEKGLCSKTGSELVVVNPEFYRPAEVELLIGDASKAERELGWRASTDLETLCNMMVQADLERNRRGVSF
jgi:GDPmannose 4,6-dehydratase